MSIDRDEFSYLIVGGIAVGLDDVLAVVLGSVVGLWP